MPVRVTGWVFAAAIASAVVLVAPAARADAAAGNAAFERGDYVRAMAEWTSAAERGDPDAEFGLGMLHERGDGQLKQDYKKAAQWYEKAAAHDNVGAQYRLALITSAGSEDFPADMVEAYKWIMLASEKGLATDVKDQLGRALDQTQRAEAEKRAAAWKKSRADEKAAATVAATPAKPSAPAAGGTAAIPPPRAGVPSAATAKSGGCPGWPFPTLPCTEQFPALPGATAPRPLALPPPRPPGPH
jgi:tetratricopeptide (TPR) repeat protein